MLVVVRVRENSMMNRQEQESHKSSFLGIIMGKEPSSKKKKQKGREIDPVTVGLMMIAIKKHIIQINGTFLCEERETLNGL